MKVKVSKAKLEFSKITYKLSNFSNNGILIYTNFLAQMFKKLPCANL